MSTKRTITILLAAALGFAQTQVDLRTQSKSVDFSGATSTRPVQTGTTLPAVCQTGQLFFKSDAPAGQNIYACTAPNVWTLEAGGSGGSGLTNCQVQRTQATVLTIFPAAALATPCIFGRGTTSALITSPATVTASAGTSLLYISVGVGGTIQVGVGNGTVVCAGCTASNATNFPADAKPVWTWTLTNGTFDSTGGTDVRALLAYKPSPVGGRGISIAAGDQDSIGTDASVVPAKFSGSGPPAAVASSTLGDTYLNTATGDYYACNNGGASCTGVAAGQWVKVSPTPGPDPGPFSQWMVDLKPVSCNFAASPAIQWDIPNASAAATFACRNLGEKVAGYAQFANTGSPTGIVHYTVPRQWTTGGVSVYLEVFGESGGGGAARFTVESYCAGSGSSILEPFAWNSPNATSTAVVTTATTVYEVNAAALTMTGCAGGNTQYLRIKRDNTVANNLGAVVNVLGAHAIFN